MANDFSDMMSGYGKSTTSSKKVTEVSSEINKANNNSSSKKIMQDYGVGSDLRTVIDTSNSKEIKESVKY